MKDLSVTMVVTVRETMTRKDNTVCKDWRVQTIQSICAKSQNKEGSMFSAISD